MAGNINGLLDVKEKNVIRSIKSGPGGLVVKMHNSLSGIQRS